VVATFRRYVLPCFVLKKTVPFFETSLTNILATRSNTRDDLNTEENLFYFRQKLSVTGHSVSAVVTANRVKNNAEANRTRQFVLFHGCHHVVLYQYRSFYYI
jgi:hypothetical protein